LPPTRSLQKEKELDLICKTSLGEKIKAYDFFSYDTSEALHLSDQEKLILQDYLGRIEMEISHIMDAHSHTLIVSTIELLLNYWVRYYDR